MSDAVLALFTGEHDLSEFDCGNEELNAWLQRHALASHKADLARTYLALDDATVAGYVSLTTGSVRPADAPKRLARGMPRYPIGTILIAAAVARLVVVDAIDDHAVGFYRRWGFTDTPDNPRRLYRTMSDVRASLLE